MNTACPQCGAETETPMVDIGVGEIPCGPRQCVDCGWMEEEPELEDFE